MDELATPITASHPPGPAITASQWQPGSTAPKDGTPFWAWLYQSGIRALRWASPEDCARAEGGDPGEYDGVFVEVDDWNSDWSPSWWIPYEAIPLPEAK